MGALPRLIGVLAFGLLCGGVGYQRGRATGDAELVYLMQLPVGGRYMAPRQQTIFERQAGGLLWLRIPDPAQARIVDLFGPKGPMPSPPTTTTTTIPDDGRIRR